MLAVFWRLDWERRMGTYIWLIPRVRPDVDLQVRLLEERLPARPNVALVALLRVLAALCPARLLRGRSRSRGRGILRGIGIGVRIRCSCFGVAGARRRGERLRLD